MNKLAAIAILFAALTTSRASTILFDLSPGGTDRALGMTGAEVCQPNANRSDWR